jgi:3-hydroxyisobutyrate dehydrogenase-like beta-hydroxyacid dehydrogenase
MGSAIAAQLRVAGHRVLWCPVGRSAGSVRRAEQAGLEPAADLAELLAASEAVFSICPPAAAQELAEEVATAGFGGIFVEANAISPQRMSAIARRFGSTDARVVDGAIIGPPPSTADQARVYLSGPGAAVAIVLGLLDLGSARPVSLGERIGQASALKMAYGSFQKTSRALAAVSHAIADDYGVTEELLVEADLLGPNALIDRDHLPSAAARAWRWAPEMLEAAESARALGLPDALATGSAEVMARWAADRDDFDLDPATALRHLHRDPE